MKVEDLGLGPSYQVINSNQQLQDAKRDRINFFSFISISQLDSQKLRIFSFIVTLYFLLQVSFVSFWPQLDLTTKDLVEKFDFIRTTPNVKGNLTEAFFFYSTTAQPKTLYIISFIIFGIVIIYVTLSVLCFCLYFFKRIINFSLLLFFNTFVHIISPLLLIPLGFHIGWLITKILQLKHLEELGSNTSSFGSIPVYTAIIVLDCFIYVVIVCVTIANNIFNSNSILICEPYFVTLNGIFKSLFMIVPSVLLLLSNVVPILASSLRYVVVVIHMIFYICMAIWSFWLPFGIVKANSVTSALSISILISDFLCFTTIDLSWYRYLIFIGCFIVFFILMNLLMKFRIDSILKSKKKKSKREENNQLNENDEHSNNNAIRAPLFGDPNIEPTGFESFSVSKCLFVLKTAIIVKSNVFLDGKLLDLILTKVENDLEKIQLAFYISYFPDFQSIFFSLLTSLKHAQFLPFLKEFQLYQLRCFDNSCHPNSKIDEVENLVNKTSALEIHIRSVWQVIESECRSFNELFENKNENLPKNLKIKANLFSNFDRLSLSIANCHSSWKSLISFYPNNVQVANEYSRFLIKCCGDYIGASEWLTLSKLIEEGKTYKFNPALVSFLRAYPQYAKQVFPKNSVFTNLDDIEIHNKIDTIGQLIEMPETRFEYQRSTLNSYPLSIFVFLLLSIISFLYFVIYWTKSLSSFRHFDQISESLYFIVNTGVLSEQVSKVILNVIMGYGQEPSTGFFPSADDIFNTIYENGWSDRINSIYDFSVIDLYQDHKQQLSFEIEQGLISLDFLHLSALDEVEKGNSFDEFFSLFFNNDQPTVFYLSKNHSITAELNLQSNLVSFFAYYFTISLTGDYSFVDDNDFYHATASGDQALEILDSVSKSILNNNEQVLKKIDYVNSTEIFILVSVYIVFSCVSILIVFVFIKKKFQSIINSLIYFPRSVKKKASYPIINKSASESENTNSTSNNNNNNYNSNNNDTEFNEGELDDTQIYDSQIKIKNFVLISLSISIILHIALGCILFSFYFVYRKYKSQFISLTELIHYHTFEAAQVIEVVYSVMAANVFGRILPIVDSKYKDVMMRTRQKFSRTHEDRWSYSVDGDCGVGDYYLTIINDLKNKPKCPEWPNKTYHEIIACLSEESGVNAFIDMTDTMINNINDPNLFHTEIFMQYLYFALTNIYYDVGNFAYYLMLATLEKDIDYVNTHQIFGAVSLIVCSLLFILNILIYLKIRGTFRLLFTFISRVNPSEMILNSHLLSSLFGIKNNNKKEIDNSETSYLIQESSLPIIFIDRSTLIEFINIAFSRKFGYEANFIVGQPISTIIEDDSVLFYIDKMKFFGTKESVSRTISIKKDNGSKALYNITIIPIHDSSINKKMKESDLIDIDIENENENETSKETFVNRIAIVFEDKSTEKNLEKKCKNSQQLTDKIASYVYPQVFSLYVEGCLQMCAICLIKLPNSLSKETPVKNLLTQYANIYERITDKLNIYPLLFPLDSRNEIFSVIAFKKNDPTELAIECLNFAFNIIEEFDNLSTSPSSVMCGLKILGQFFAVVETCGELVVGWLGNKIKRVIITGELMERAMKVLDNASRAGTICVSKKTYECLIQHDYLFYEKEIQEEICGSKSIYSIEKNSIIAQARSENEYSSNYGNSSIIFNMKEESVKPY